MGEWSRAMMISIGYCGLPFVLYYAIGEGLPTDSVAFMSFVTIFLLFVSVYLLFSFTGWLTLGIFFHWLICKYTTGNAIYYVLAVALLSCISNIIVSSELVLFFGVISLAQALVFKYHINKFDT